MYCSKLFHIAAISLAVVVSTCLAQSLTYDERCQIIEGNGVRVDQCDGTKMLSCRDGRCQCPDSVNHVYTYRNEIVPGRNKRSPGKKGGGFKKVAIGAAAGAAVGAGTYHVVNNAGKSFNTTPKPPKYQKVYSCYSRVGGQCALNYNNWESVSSETTTTTTTTVAPSTSEASTDNSTSNSTTTTTTAAPQAAAQVSNKLDISKVPRCVQYATCRTGSPTVGANGTSSSSGFMQKVDFDPRLGVCVCDVGYAKTSRDLCERQKSGAGKTVTGASFAVILATLVINKMFV